MTKHAFKPLHLQFDAGFGVTAESFHEAAKTIDTSEFQFGFGRNRSRLPVDYLYRHAIELYLKSTVTVLHRRFHSTFPQYRQDDFPLIFDGGKDKPIYSIHSVLVLFHHMNRMLEEDLPKIRAIDESCVPAIDDSDIELIEKIDSVDRSSTLFRYPVTKQADLDAKKSSFKQINPLDIGMDPITQSRKSSLGVTLFSVDKTTGEFSDAFVHDPVPMPDVTAALRDFATKMSNVVELLLFELMSRPDPNLGSSAIGRG